LNKLGIGAGMGVVKAYYFAYPIGIIIAFCGFFLVNHLFPIDSSTRATGWREPKEYSDAFDASAEILDGQPVEISTNAEGSKQDKRGFNATSHSV
jgi:NCS1 family nucleobase:cation symporter-1